MSLYESTSHLRAQDLEELFKRKLYTWEKDLLYIMRLTMSDNWTGASRNAAYALSPTLCRGYAKAGDAPNWQSVSEDQLNTMPGIYKRTDCNKVFAFLGLNRILKLDNDKQANDILTLLASNKSLVWAYELVTGKII